MEPFCPVDVISFCGVDGEIRPIRFRIEDTSHRLLRVDVQQIISKKKVQYVGIDSYIFLCRAVVEETPWLFELKYTVQTHRWTLARRVY